MKRLALFFFLACLSVFGAIGASVHCLKKPRTLGQTERQKAITLALYSPPSPAAVKAKEKKPKEQKRAEKPKPKPKPKPETRQKPKPKPVPQEQPPEPAPEEPRPLEQTAENETAKTAETTHDPDRFAAEQPGSAVLNPVDEYFARLYSRISRHKYYPQKAKRFGVEGEVSVAFVLDAEGRIVDASLVKKSGRRCLDRAAMEIFRRIGQFEKPPESMMERRFEITIDYHLS